MDPSRQYRFRSSDLWGVISIESERVETTIRHGFNAWTFSTPTSEIVSNPIRSWSTPNLFWLVLACGVAGLGMSIWDFVYNDPDFMPGWMIAIALPLSILLVSYSLRIRREEWVSFPCRIEGHWIRFCRSGADKANFDAFTLTLINEIEAASKRTDSLPAQH